ncbi:MAG: SH3 domain-containing protein [Paracoccaceae bacterium]|nr:MAG: SH3 domain-containing protein [Paracoccaceae bacterium]
MLGTHEVIARSGLNLRKGPGEQFGISAILPVGHVVSVRGYDEPGRHWAYVDLNGDGRVDGCLFADYLQPTDAEGHENAPASG